MEFGNRYQELADLLSKLQVRQMCRAASTRCTRIEGRSQHNGGKKIARRFWRDASATWTKSPRATPHSTCRARTPVVRRVGVAKKWRRVQVLELWRDGQTSRRQRPSHATGAHHSFWLRFPSMTDLWRRGGIDDDNWRIHDGDDAGAHGGCPQLTHVRLRLPAFFVQALRLILHATRGWRHNMFYVLSAGVKIACRLHR